MMKALPHVDFLVNYATTWSNRIFSSVAEAKRRSVRFGTPLKLAIGGQHPITKMDVKMCSVDKRAGTIFTALASHQEPHRVHLFRVNMAITNGISDNQSVETCVVDLGTRSLVDLKFLDDKTLILFCTNKGNPFQFPHQASWPSFLNTMTDNTPLILSIPIQDDHKLSYSTYDPAHHTEVASKTNTKVFHRFTLPTSHHALRPVRMGVHEKSNVRGDLPARICLLGGNRTTWRTYALPSQG